MKTRKLKISPTEDIEKALKPIMYKLTSVKSGRMFGTVEVQFMAESDIMMKSATGLQTSKLILLPSYLDKGMKIRMINVFDLELKPMRLLVAAFANVNRSVRATGAGRKMYQELVWQVYKSNNPDHIDIRS